MTSAVHLHQSGPEVGSATLGPQQFHFEGGPCVGIQQAPLFTKEDQTESRAENPRTGSGPWPWTIADHWLVTAIK